MVLLPDVLKASWPDIQRAEFIRLILILLIRIFVVSCLTWLKVNGGTERNMKRASSPFTILDMTVSLMVWVCILCHIEINMAVLAGRIGLNPGIGRQKRNW